MQRSEEIIDRFIAFNRFKNVSFQFKVMWSEKFNQYMIITEEKIIFDDGIEYLAEELACIKVFSDSMLKAQHAARKVFGAELKILG